MGKKTTVSHANKMIRELSAEANMHKEASRRSLRIGLVMLLSFVVLILIEQTLAYLGVFGEAVSKANNITLGILMLIAFISIHFWINYMREYHRSKECKRAAATYQDAITD